MVSRVTPGTSDIFYALSDENIRRLQEALIEFAFPAEEIPVQLFRDTKVVAFGMEPHRVDLLNAIDGVEFSQAYKNSVSGEFERVPVRFIGRSDLIANKKAAGRPQDELDAIKLQEL